MAGTGDDKWQAAANYERYMGRWSSLAARQFLHWLAPPAGQRWLDLGCGTGALSAEVLARCAPEALLGVEPAADFLEAACIAISDPRAGFAAGSADSIPVGDAGLDILVSGLAYNFFPDRPGALREMQRVLLPGGLLAMYVWDYPSGGLGFIDEFWRAAGELRQDAAGLDERKRFAFCTRSGLEAELSAAGLESVNVAPLEFETVFMDFDDFWQPFTLGSGPAPAYFAGLPTAAQDALHAMLLSQYGACTPLAFPARAWALQARKAE